MLSMDAARPNFHAFFFNLGVHSACHMTNGAASLCMHPLGQPLSHMWSPTVSKFPCVRFTTEIPDKPGVDLVAVSCQMDDVMGLQSVIK
jgi:hypothetical protein